MPIAPITGRLRKGLWRDISVALGLGLGAGYAFWYVCSSILFFAVSLLEKVWLPSQSRYDHTRAHDSLSSVSVVERREEYYLKIERERAQAQAA